MTLEYLQNSPLPWVGEDPPPSRGRGFRLFPSFEGSESIMSDCLYGVYQNVLDFLRKMAL